MAATCTVNDGVFRQSNHSPGTTKFPGIYLTLLTTPPILQIESHSHNLNLHATNAAYLLNY